MGFAVKLILFNIGVIVILCFYSLLNKKFAQYLLPKVSSKWRWVFDPFNYFDNAGDMYSFYRELPSTMLILSINGLVFINILIVTYYFVSSS